MKSLLYTHTDLDGVGSAVLATLLATLESEWDIQFLDNSQVSAAIQELFTSSTFEKYDRIVVADLPVTMATAETLYHLSIFREVRLLDHHKTTLPVADRYPEWATVVVEDESIPQCGTLLFYKEFCQDIQSDLIDNFVEAVRAWDTWTWQTDGNELSEKLQLLHLNSRSNIDFTKMMSSNLREGSILTEKNRVIIAHAKLEECKYLENMKNKWFEFEYEGNKFAAVLAGRYSSKLGNIISKEHPEYVGVVMLTEYGLSFRTSRTDFDVSAVAKSLGGGGHQQAAGASFNATGMKLLMEAAFESMKKQSQI